MTDPRPIIIEIHWTGGEPIVARFDPDLAHVYVAAAEDAMNQPHAAPQDPTELAIRLQQALMAILRVSGYVSVVNELGLWAVTREAVRAVVVRAQGAEQPVSGMARRAIGFQLGPDAR